MDMKIDLDVTGLSQSRIADQIILTAEDTSCIPAVKVRGCVYGLEPSDGKVSGSGIAVGAPRSWVSGDRILAK